MKLSIVALLLATASAATDNIKVRHRNLKKGKKSKKKKSKGIDGLIALISTAPSYTGELQPYGTTNVHFNDDGSFLFTMSMSGLDAACEACKVSINDGTSCDAPGAGYFSLETNPWETGTSFYFSYADSGLAGNGFTISNGYGEDDNEGQTVVFYDSSDEIIGCGVLEEAPTSSTLNADMGSYPGYAGDLEVEGEVTVSFNNDDTFKFSFDLEGLEDECNGCGIHIHAGLTCDDAALVLGHGWNTVSTQDLWTSAGGSVYNSEDGEAKGSFALYNGFSYIENRGHAVVIHAQDGSRIGCGVLE